MHELKKRHIKNKTGFKAACSVFFTVLQGEWFGSNFLPRMAFSMALLKNVYTQNVVLQYHGEINLISNPADLLFEIQDTNATCVFLHSILSMRN